MNYDKTPIAEFEHHMFAGPWTQFDDCHSGGGTNTEYEVIYIQAPQDEAIAVFGARFGMSPYSVNCSCCGQNYSVSECADFTQATGWDRNLVSTEEGYTEDLGIKGSRLWSSRPPISIMEYLNSNRACFIFARDIKEEERESWNIVEPFESYDEYDSYSDESEDQE